MALMTQVENPMEYTKQPSGIQEFSKVKGYKAKNENQWHFHILAMNDWRKKQPPNNPII